MNITHSHSGDMRTYRLDGCEVMIHRAHHGNMKNPPMLFAGAHYFTIRRDDLARTIRAIRKQNIEHARWKALT